MPPSIDHSGDPKLPPLLQELAQPPPPILPGLGQSANRFTKLSRWSEIRDCSVRLHHGTLDSVARHLPISVSTPMPHASRRIAQALQEKGWVVRYYCLPGFDETLGIPVILGKEATNWRGDPVQRSEHEQTVDRGTTIIGCILGNKIYRESDLHGAYDWLIDARASRLKERVRHDAALINYPELSAQRDKHDHKLHVMAVTVGSLLGRVPAETNFEIFAAAFGTLKANGLPDAAIMSADEQTVEIALRPVVSTFNLYRSAGYGESRESEREIQDSRAAMDGRVEFKLALERLRANARLVEPSITVSERSLHLSHKWQGVEFHSVVITVPTEHVVRAASALRLFLTREASQERGGRYGGGIEGLRSVDRIYSLSDLRLGEIQSPDVKLPKF